MTASADTTFRCAWALIDGLAAAGVRRAVLSPGSRSTPLALAALRHPGLITTIVIDERSAAFFALGMAKAERLPAVVIATSGSAVANWAPAVVEADLGQVPLLLLSADRPPELHHCGANQTMDQLKLFGDHVRLFRQLPPAEEDCGWLAGLAAEAVDGSLGPLPGPVHLNVPLREPLVPSVVSLPVEARPPVRLSARTHASAESLSELASLITGQGAIVCGSEPLGPDFAGAVTALAEHLNAPVFADILSGLRFGCGEEPVLAYPDAVARRASRPDWILRFGGMPVSKAVAQWLERSRGCVQVVVSTTARVADPGRTASHVITADAAGVCLDLLTGVAERPAEHPLDPRFRGDDERNAEAACTGPLFEGAVLRALCRGLPDGTALFLGNSLTVRAADWFAGRSPRRLRPFGNRGVSGIDGNLSTAYGIAATGLPTVAVVGDLTFLHDLGALALGRTMPLTIVVLDNGGGGIFDHLPQAQLPEFETGWLTAPSLDILAAARSFGLTARRAASTSEVMAAIGERVGVICVPIDRAVSLRQHRTFFSSGA